MGQISNGAWVSFTSALTAQKDQGARALALQAQGLLNNLQVGQPFSAIVAREGFQLTGTSIGVNNASVGFTVGQSLGGLGPSAGQAWYLESITFASTKDVCVWVQRANASLIANGAASALFPVCVGPSYGSPTINVADIVPEGESLSFVLQTAVAASSTPGTADWTFRAGFNGRRITNDFSYEAPKVLLALGDSITNTTGPTYGADFHQFQVKRWLWKQGKKYRVINKGDGGWATSHAFIAMQRGVFAVPQADLIYFMLGTNETSLANFQANFPAFLAWKQDYYPSAKMLILGPPPRQDSIETSVLQPIRAYEATTVAALGDRNVSFCSLANAFNPSGDTYYFTADGTTSGTRIHPNSLGHAAMAVAEEACLTATGWAL